MLGLKLNHVSKRGPRWPTHHGRTSTMSTAWCQYFRWFAYIIDLSLAIGCHWTRPSKQADLCRPASFRVRVSEKKIGPTWLIGCGIDLLEFTLMDMWSISMFSCFSWIIRGNLWCWKKFLTCYIMVCFCHLMFCTCRINVTSYIVVAILQSIYSLATEMWK